MIDWLIDGSCVIGKSWYDWFFKNQFQDSNTNYLKYFSSFYLEMHFLSWMKNVFKRRFYFYSFIFQMKLHWIYFIARWLLLLFSCKTSLVLRYHRICFLAIKNRLINFCLYMITLHFSYQQLMNSVFSYLLFLQDLMWR